MHLSVPQNASLATLDQFLRAVWLKCCGHLSSFHIDKQRYSFDPALDPDEKGMKVAVSKVLAPGLKFEHSPFSAFARKAPLVLPSKSWLATTHPKPSATNAERIRPSRSAPIALGKVKAGSVRVARALTLVAKTYSCRSSILHALASAPIPVKPTMALE